MSSDNQAAPKGYPAVTPLSLEAIFSLYQDNVIQPYLATGLPPKILVEESFWAGAESVMSIMARAKLLGASVEEGAALIGRVFQEIQTHGDSQRTRLMQAGRDAARD